MEEEILKLIHSNNREDFILGWRMGLEELGREKMLSLFENSEDGRVLTYNFKYRVWEGPIDLYFKELNVWSDGKTIQCFEPDNHWKGVGEIIRFT